MQWPPTRPGREAQEIPFGPGRRQHVARRDPKPIEDDRKLVHQRDVEIALGVLDDLGRLGDLDRRRPMNTGADDAAIHRGDPLQGLVVLARDDLRDRLEAMFAVAGIDPLRRVAELEIGTLFEDPRTSPIAVRRSRASSPDKRSIRIRRPSPAAASDRSMRRRFREAKGPDGAPSRSASGP